MGVERKLRFLKKSKLCKRHVTSRLALGVCCYFLLSTLLPRGLMEREGKREGEGEREGEREGREGEREKWRGKER